MFSVLTNQINRKAEKFLSFCEKSSTVAPFPEKLHCIHRFLIVQKNVAWLPLKTL